MGKGKPKSKAPPKSNSNSKGVIKRRQHSQQLPLKKQKTVKSKHQHQSGQRPPKVPFSTQDNVLLVGEGDFSFALSLAKHHKPASLTATCYDGEDELVQKYPTVKDTIRHLVQPATGVPDNKASATNDEEPAWDGFSSADSAEEATSDERGEGSNLTQCNVLYGVDATKLSTSHRKKLRSYGPFSKIVFNFPHVGGLSTDVNRQVRSNQQLLVGFFNAAKPLLVSNGHILVTIFEGEPYTLWNVRDLGRHCGLQVVESFQFPWHAYPGYQHARTLGEIIAGKDRVDEGRRKGAWRGEERDARCYMFQCKEDASAVGNVRKRKRGGDVGDDDSD